MVDPLPPGEVAERARARDEVAQLLAEAQRLWIGIGVIWVVATVLAVIWDKRSSPDTWWLTMVTQQMDGFASEVCACRDAACSERVSERLARWVVDHAAADIPSMNRDRDAKQRLDAIIERYVACTTRVHDRR